MLFIFDLDGTLVDTTELHADTFVQAFRELEGREVSRERVKSYIGMSGVEICRLLGARDPEGVYARKTELFLARLDEIREMEGATEVLSELRSRGHRVALATSSNRTMTRAMLRRFDWEFDAVVTADDVRKGKPDPEMVERLVSRFPGEALLVGDTDYDRKMAEAAGIRALILGREIHSLREILQLPEAGHQ